MIGRPPSQNALLWKVNNLRVPFNRNKKKSGYLPLVPAYDHLIRFVTRPCPCYTQWPLLSAPLFDLWIENQVLHSSIWSSLPPPTTMVEARGLMLLPPVSFRLCHSSSTCIHLWSRGENPSGIPPNQFCVHPFLVMSLHPILLLSFMPVPELSVSGLRYHLSRQPQEVFFKFSRTVLVIFLKQLLTFIQNS